jgi:hypothetical protein
MSEPHNPQNNVVNCTSESEESCEKTHFSIEAPYHLDLALEEEELSQLSSSTWSEAQQLSFLVLGRTSLYFKSNV